jgi:hypothetical protein
MTLTGRTRKLKSLKPDTRVKIATGSGIDSGKTGTIVSWDTVPQLATDYPFVAGRTPQSMGWLAVKLDSGGIQAFPKSRVNLIGDDLVFPAHPPELEPLIPLFVAESRDHVAITDERDCIPPDAIRINERLFPNRQAVKDCAVSYVTRGFKVSVQFADVEYFTEDLQESAIERDRR